MFLVSSTRGLELAIIDDRTFKVTSAYMHLACSFRTKGCPFILKLTKAKEGGWVMKTNRDSDIDPKQRSNYNCQHGPGNYGSVLVEGPILKPTSSRSTRKSTGESPAKRVISNAKPMSKAKARDPLQLNSAPIVSLDSNSSNGRSIAPLDRSLALLSQIEPVLSPYNKGHPYSSSTPSSSSAFNNAMYADPRVNYSNQPRNSKLSDRNRPPMYEPPFYVKKLPKPSPTLSQWTAFLTLLDPELISVAIMLADPKLEITPTSFFEEDDDILIEFLDSLDLPAWPKLKLRTKIIKSGREVWAGMKAMFEPKESTTVASSSAASTPPLGTPVVSRVEESVIEEMRLPAMGTGINPRAAKWVANMVIPPFSASPSTSVPPPPSARLPPPPRLDLGLTIPAFNSRPKINSPKVTLDIPRFNPLSTHHPTKGTPLIVPTPTVSVPIPGIGIGRASASHTNGASRVV